jgi:hypothetical protein
MFSQDDITEASIIYTSFRADQLSTLDSIPITIAESSRKGVQLIKIPQHIYRHLMDNGKQMVTPETITFIKPDGTTEIVNNPSQYLKQIRTNNLYNTDNNTDTRKKAEADKPADNDSGYEDNRDQPEETDKNNDWQTPSDGTEHKQNGTKQERYHTGTCTIRANRYSDNHHDIAFSETKEFIDSGKDKEVIPPRLSEEARDDAYARARDFMQQPDEVYSNCEQCTGHPRHRLRLDAHKHSRVRILVVHDDAYLSRPMEISNTKIINVPFETDNNIRAQNWAIHGREAYWKSSKYFQYLLDQSESYLRETFPLRTSIELKVDIELTPICVSYTTASETIYVIPIETVTQQMLDAPEPKHSNDGIYFVNDHYDAEYYVTFLIREDTKMAKHLQLRASEDELVQRLKAIQLDTPSSHLTNLGKIILAYATFQERRYNQEFQRKWKPSDKVTPIEELCDLRTQIDLKQKERDSFDYNHYRNRSTSYHLRKGIMQRQRRIQQRNQNSQYHKNTNYGQDEYNQNLSWRKAPIPAPRNQIITSTRPNYQTYSDAVTRYQKVEPLKLIKTQSHSQNNQERNPTEDSWQVYSRNKRSPQRQNNHKETFKERETRTPRTERSRQPRQTTEPMDTEEDWKRTNKKRKRSPSRDRRG